MKKFFLVAAMVLGFAVAASAQPRALGLRIGNFTEISYQHGFNSNFLEVDGGVGFGSTLDLGATGIYNFMIAQPAWTDRGEWGFYAGPGARVGLGVGEHSYFNLAAAGMIGLEYSFWFPLQLSIDYRQVLGYSLGLDKLYAPYSFALGVRYRF